MASSFWAEIGLLLVAIIAGVLLVVGTLWVVPSAVTYFGLPSTRAMPLR